MNLKEQISELRSLSYLTHVCGLGFFSEKQLLVMETCVSHDVYFLKVVFML